MAAPNKVGLTYFSFDTKMEDDPKIKLLTANYKSIGIHLYIHILEITYGEDGYYFQITKDNLSILSKDIQINLDTVIEIITFMIDKDLFNYDLFCKYKILTSKRIQKNYLKGCAKRNQVKLNPNYLLINPKDEKGLNRLKIILDDKTECDLERINGRINGIKSVFNVVKSVDYDALSKTNDVVNETKSNFNEMKSDFNEIKSNFDEFQGNTFEATDDINKSIKNVYGLKDKTSEITDNINKPEGNTNKVKDDFNGIKDDFNGIKDGINVNMDKLAEVEIDKKNQIKQSDFQNNSKAFTPSFLNEGRQNERAKKNENKQEDNIYLGVNDDFNGVKDDFNPLKKRKEKKIKEYISSENFYASQSLDFEKFPFDVFWNLYEKKVGNKEKLKKKWDKLKPEEQKKAIEYIPTYVKSTPDKKYRKNPETFLNNKSWNDEIIGNDDNDTTPVYHSPYDGGYLN